MVIERGNYFRKDYALTEDTTVTGGNFVLCHVTTNGFNLDIQGGNVRGLYIDDVKQDAYVWQRKEPWALVVPMLDLLRARNLMTEYEWIIDQIHANPTDGPAAFVAAYEAQDFYLYQGKFLTLFEQVSGLSGFTAVRDAIAAQPKARLMGEATEVVEEYS